ncbi:MAG: 16S rRNA (cytidine(1402)-2'-O)-methyltransferase [Halocynthiibacter sp.]
MTQKKDGTSTMANFESRPLAAGLHFVATPIGAARDITLRALDVLAAADVIAAEDTRTMRKLLDIHAVPVGDRPLIAYHDHNGARVRPRLLALMAEGKSLAYASEAGTPLVADPGYALARAAIDAGIMVTSVPGPSAMIAALTVAGLPTDRFFFAGFAPPARGARQSFLEKLSEIPATLVFYESPKRVAAFLGAAASVFGDTRNAAVCRELTKKFEEITRAPLGELSANFAERAVKGEIVVLIERAHAVTTADATIDAALTAALLNMSVKDAAATVAEALGLPRRKIYQAALALGNSRDEKT